MEYHVFEHCFVIVHMQRYLLVFQMRDLRAVGTKFWHLMYPKEKKALLKECELLFH